MKRYEIVESDRFDQADLAEMTDLMPKLRRTLGDIEDATPTGSDLGPDLWSSLIRIAPQKKGPVPPSHRVNETVIDRIWEADDYRDLKQHTAGDPVACAMGLTTLSRQVTSMLSELGDVAEQAQKAQDAQDALEQALGGDGDQPGAGEPGNQAGGGSDEEELESLRSTAETEAARLDEMIDENLPKIDSAVRAALGEAAADAEHQADTAAGWDLSPGDMNRMDPADRIRLMGTLNDDRVRQIAELMGAMVNTALGQRDQTLLYRPGEIVGITLGGNLSRLIPGEVAALAVPELEDLLMLRVARRRAREYLTQIVERAGRGAIIYCADEETEILTAAGWKRYDQVMEGEQVLTLNHDSGLAEWGPVTRMTVFPRETRSMLKMEGQRHSSLTTLDHRWPIIHQSRPRIDGRQDARVPVREWRTSGTLASEDQLIVAAACATLPAIPKYTDAFVELVAWVWTEGTVTPTGGLRVYQSHAVHPEHCERIRRALTAELGPPTSLDMRSVRDGTPLWHEKADAEGMTTFHLNQAAAEPLLDVMDRTNKAVDPAFVTQLTGAQLQMFVDRSIDGDGTARNGCVVLGQKDPRRLVALEIACVLLGMPVRTVHEANTGGFIPDASRWTLTATTSGRRHITLSHPPGDERFTSEVVSHDGIVWCPTTPNGSWCARRRGTVYFTGNCEDQSGSMAGAKGRWSKAFGGALYRIARDQDRAFHAFCFRGQGAWQRFDFPNPKTVAIEDLLAFMSTEPDGGTEVTGPLDEAVALLRAEYDKDGTVEGDIVLATDGEVGVPADWLSEFEATRDRLGFHVYGLAIKARLSTLHALCTHVADVTDLTSARDVADVFAAVN